VIAGCKLLYIYVVAHYAEKHSKVSPWQSPFSFSLEHNAQQWSAPTGTLQWSELAVTGVQRSSADTLHQPACPTRDKR